MDGTVELKDSVIHRFAIIEYKKMKSEKLFWDAVEIVKYYSNSEVQNELSKL